MEDALSLDLSILEALLHRNRCSHGRTQYYKFMSMAMRALQRLNLQLTMEAFRRQVEVHREAVKRQEWVMNDDNDSMAKVKQQLEVVKQTFDAEIPEILSRMDRAASALFTEVARGFFLPLCTVAIAALARIRILLLRTGRTRLTELHSLLMEYKDLSLESWFETTMAQFVEETKRKADPQRLLQSLGISVSSRKRKKDSTKDSITVEEIDKEAKIDPMEDNDTASHAAVEAIRDNDDVGESVGTAVAVRAVNEATNTSTASSMRQENSDRNLELLKRVKTKTQQKEATNRKRTKEEGLQKKKKRRKESKKKKDVFDEIFGDT